MGIEIRKATPDDAEACTRIGELAFQDDLFQSIAIRRKGATKEQIDEYWTWRVGRVKARLERPGNYFFVAVDTESGQIVGSSGIIDPGVAGSNEGLLEGKICAWPAIVNKSMFDERYALLNKVRKELMGDRSDYWYVPSMAVHPDHQRRGIGRALLRADLDLADAAKGETYLESRPVAVRLYTSAGFEIIGKLEGLEDGDHPVMLRKPQAVS